MHPNKSPHSDGMSPIFFQKFWHIIGLDVVDIVKSFFHTGHLLKSFYVPKVDCPTNLSYFRPISLCNIFYKAITKLLANKLKPILNSCISCNQVAFVPGKHIFDNIIVAHEFLHFVKKKKEMVRMVLWP
ncbi:hypothetical protein ACH5RR_037566 [Cinchona calisaya]|uniref:Reverse transcriptase domain-containing protein n=1 Tax=Cinchona calisaya TaxID=153742 RepID=A0ABD2YB96_9GENT